MTVSHWAVHRDGALLSVYRQFGARVARIIEDEVVGPAPGTIGRIPMTREEACRGFSRIANNFRIMFHGLDDRSPNPPGNLNNPTCPTWYSGSFATEHMIYDCLLDGGWGDRAHPDDPPGNAPWTDGRLLTNLPTNFVKGPSYQDDWNGGDSICRYGWWTPWQASLGVEVGQVQIEHRVGCRASLSHWALSLATRAALGRYPISGAVRRVFWPWYERQSNRNNPNTVQREIDRLLSGCFHREVRAWHVDTGSVNLDWAGFGRHSRDNTLGRERPDGIYPLQRPLEVTYPKGFIEELTIPGRLYEYDLAAIWLMSAADELGADFLHTLTPEIVLEAALFRYWNSHQGRLADADGARNTFEVRGDWPAFPGYTAEWMRDDPGKRTLEGAWEPQRSQATDNPDQWMLPAFSLEDSVRLARLPLVRPEDLAGMLGVTKRGESPLCSPEWGGAWLLDALESLDRVRSLAQAMFPGAVAWALKKNFTDNENLVAAYFEAGGVTRTGKWVEMVRRLATKPDPVAGAKDYLVGIATIKGEAPLWD
jgi:hypothetical protein